jgi:hypothetical protein
MRTRKIRLYTPLDTIGKLISSDPHSPEARSAWHSLFSSYKEPDTCGLISFPDAQLLVMEGLRLYRIDGEYDRALKLIDWLFRHPEAPCMSKTDTMLYQCYRGEALLHSGQEAAGTEVFQSLTDRIEQGASPLSDITSIVYYLYTYCRWRCGSPFPPHKHLQEHLSSSPQPALIEYAAYLTTHFGKKRATRAWRPPEGMSEHSLSYDALSNLLKQSFALNYQW